MKMPTNMAHSGHTVGKQLPLKLTCRQLWIVFCGFNDGGVNRVRSIEQHQDQALAIKPPHPPPDRKIAGADLPEITWIFSDSRELMQYSFVVRGLLMTHSLAAVLEHFTFCSEAEKSIKCGFSSSPAAPPQVRG